MTPQVAPRDSGRWIRADASTLAGLRDEFRRELFSRSRSSFEEWRSGQADGKANAFWQWATLPAMFSGDARDILPEHEFRVLSKAASGGGLTEPLPSGAPVDPGDYPWDRTIEEKNAWAKASTAYLTAQAEQADAAQADSDRDLTDAEEWDWEGTRWLGENKTVPRLHFEVFRSGAIVFTRRPARARMPRPRRQAQTTQTRRRAGGARSRDGPGSSEPPLPDLGRLAAASSRCWHHVRRREARQRAGLVSGTARIVVLPLGALEDGGHPWGICWRCEASARTVPCHLTVVAVTRAAAVECDDAAACERRRYRNRLGWWCAP